MKKSLIGFTVLAGGLVLAGCSSTLDETPQDVHDSVVVEEAAQKPTPTPTPTQEPTHTAGDAAAVDGWDVKITEVALNANGAISSANPYNDPPTGQYVLVTLTGTNTTVDEFKDLDWLSARFLGSDKRVYDEGGAVTPFDNADGPTEAAPGGTVSAQFLFDVPVAALGSGASVLLGYDNEQFVVVP